MKLLSKLKKDKKIGLALGGGGIRGLAHAGVLSVLQRENIPIHAIAGSSMGAIIGAAFVLNDELDENFLIEQVKQLGISVPISLYENAQDNTSLLKNIKNFLEKGRFMIDALWGWGALPDERILETLKKLTGGRKLEEARIPISVVTTDLISGKKIIFREGPADFAIHASSALPGFLPPVHYNNHLLADGAFVDLVPAGVVREMGVDYVIAVDVDQENVQVEIHNGLEAFLRAIELCARHHKHHHLSLADLVIQPDFGEHVNPLDFSKAELCLEAGYKATEKALSVIKTHRT